MIITCIIVYVVTVLLYLGMLKYCKKALEAINADVDKFKGVTFIPVVNSIALIMTVVILLVENGSSLNNKIVDKIIGEDDE